jgi:cytochrome P450
VAKFYFSDGSLQTTEKTVETFIRVGGQYRSRMGVLDPDGEAPGPSLGAVLQMVPDLVGTDPTEVARRLRDDYGYVVRIPPLHPALDSGVYLVTHPDDVQFVLQTHPSKFGPLDVPGSQDFGKVVENSIVSLTPDGEGTSWTKRLRMVSPEFTERAVAEHVPALAETTLATLAEFEAESVTTGSPGSVPKSARVIPADGEGVVLLPAMQRLTLRLLGESLFGADVRAHEVEVVDAVHQLRRLFKQRQLNVVTSRVTRHLPEELRLPTWLQGHVGGDPSIRLRADTDRQAADAIDRLAGVADAIVRQRLQAPLVYDDALSAWMLRPDPVDEDVLAPETLRQEVVGLLIAGHATTSAALTWAFYLLASRPGVQERIHREARSTPLLADAAALQSPELGFDPAADDVDGAAVVEDLRYTRQVWQETLRLYPVLPMFGRTTAEDVELGGFDIEKGSHVLLSPYVTHRDEAFWDDPERFDPGRFDPGRAAARHEFAHYPFSGGRHACLGEAIATTEAVVVLATTLATHRVEFVTDDDPEMGPHPDESGYSPDVGVDSAINLQPDREIRVRFVPRA